MTNIEYLKSIEDNDEFASELYAIIKSFKSDINYVELNNALESEQNHLTNILCYIVCSPCSTEYVDKELCDDVNIELYDKVYHDKNILVFLADDIYSLDAFIAKYEDRFDTIILQYTQDGCRKTWLNRKDTVKIVMNVGY